MRASGTPEMTGAVLSVTVTWKSACAVAASVAVQWTVVAPTGKVEPAAGEHATATAPSTGSLAVALYDTVAPAGPVASTEMSPGNDSDGGFACTTVMKND